MAFVYQSPTPLQRPSPPKIVALGRPHTKLIKTCSPAIRSVRLPISMKSGKNARNTPTEEVPEVEDPQPPAYESEEPYSSSVSEASIESPQVTDADNGNNDNGNHSGGNGDHGRDDEDKDDEPPISTSTSAPIRHVEEPVLQEVTQSVEPSKSFVNNVSDSFEAFFRVVPAPIVVALISVSSTITASRIKNQHDEEKEKKKAFEAARKEKLEIENELRKVYSELAGPILKSATKLAERIYCMVDADCKTPATGLDSHLSSTYSAYLLGRYLASVEIIKQESSVMDFGFPAADRIFANVLARVQGVLAADNSTLLHMQKVERFFRPKDGDEPLEAGPLRLVPRDQVVMGELLLRRFWMNKYDFIDKKDSSALTRGPQAIMSFWEFTRVLQKEEELARWYQPVIDEFSKIEQFVQKTPKSERRTNELGARLYFLQASLMDLVDFFDPMPGAKTVPFYKRNRLQLGNMHFDEEQHMPMSLRLLYKELSRVRDHRVLGGDKMERMRLPHGVEVYVKAAHSDLNPSILSGGMGDCPYSHRVLIVLREMCIPHKLVTIPYDAKPSWFHLLHPENNTPVMYHEGKLVEDSMQIVSYLFDNFPDAKKLSSAAKLELSSGEAGFTRFHNRFAEWLSGNEKARLELDKELRSLDKMLFTAQAKNDGQPFLGGDHFSREDTAIAPMLNNIEVAGRVIRGWTFPSECHALRKYLDAARKVPSFSGTAASEEVIVQGYDRLIKMGGKAPAPIANLLE